MVFRHLLPPRHRLDTFVQNEGVYSHFIDVKIKPQSSSVHCPFSKMSDATESFIQEFNPGNTENLLITDKVSAIHPFYSGFQLALHSFLC